MASRIEKKLLKTPVAERRGVWTTWEGNSWEATLVKTGFDDLTARLADGAGIGGVFLDFSDAILDGSQPAPDGGWYLIVELVGSPWLHVAQGYGVFAHLKQLTKLAQAPVLQTGHEDTANATYAILTDAGEKTLHFESTGMGSDDEEYDDDEDFEDEIDDPCEVPLRFETELLPKEWTDQFKSEDQVQQALMRELDAYVPLIGAAAEDGRITLWGGHEDVLDKQYITRIALVLVGEKRSATPDPRGRALYDAIRASDAEAAGKALAAGASMTTLPETERTALGLALSGFGREPEATTLIVEMLLEAGADPDAGGPGQNPPLMSALDKAGNEPGRAAVLCDRLLDAGASLSAKGAEMDEGKTPLHKAASAGQLAMVQMLHARGADPSVLDAQGRTPRQAVEQTIEQMLEWMGEDADEHLAGQREVVAYLQAAEDGAPPNDDWREQLDEAEKQATRTRRKSKVEFGKLRKAFEQLGELAALEENEQDESEEDAAGETVQDLVDAVGAGHARKLLSTHEGGIDLRPDDGPWENTNEREKHADAFDRLGFEPLGYFVADGLVPTRLLAYINEREGWFGVIYETSGMPIFCDIVRLHADDSVLTVTSTAQPAPYELDRFRKVRLPGKDVKKLAEAMSNEPVPACGLKPISADSFVQVVKWVTAEEQAELLRSLG